jgi:hypothetical protein
VFESKSKLKEIERNALSDTALDMFEIPPECQILNGLSLRGVKSFTISRENPFFVIEEPFLESSDRKRLIWYMGSEHQVVVKKEVEVIGEGCFASSQYLCEVMFEEGSKVRRLERRAFLCTDLEKVTIPASVEVIGEECFGCCGYLREVVYEGQVPSIAENAFRGCPL